MAQQPTRVSYASAQILITALLWVLLFELNKWLFTSTSISPYINWVFLPAALRMVSVLLLGTTGAIGLVCGALVTSNTNGPLIDAIILAVLSGLCPYLSVVICHNWLRLPKDLSGLNGKQLLGMAIAGGLLSVLAHHVYWFSSNQIPQLFDGAFAMLVGDILGALIMLYAVKLTILGIDKARANIKT